MRAIWIETVCYIDCKIQEINIIIGKSDEKRWHEEKATENISK